jgi:ribosomal-protein-alanine N-acetyltransferase
MRDAIGSIRPVEVADADALAELYARNRAFLRPFTPVAASDFFSAEGQRRRTRAAVAEARRGTLRRFVILDDSAELAGVVALENIIRGPAQTANLAYWVDEARNGRGLATHAVAAVLEEAFGPLALHRIEASTLVDNAASQRVLVRNAFERIGLARRYLHIDGAWRDHLLFQRTRD